MPSEVRPTPTPTPEQTAPTAPEQTTPTAPNQTAPTTPDQTAPVAPGATPEQTTPTAPDQTTAPEPRVLVAEVLVSGVEGDLQEEVYRAIRTQPGRTTTRSQLQEDINAIFATGYFSNVQAVPEDTPLGVRVTFVVQLNPVLRSVQIEGKKVLPDQVIQDAFSEQYGSVLNLVRLQEGIKKVNKWYQDNGYVLAQVVNAPKVSPDGVVTLDVAEGIVENIQVRFVNKEGDDKDAKGNPIKGRTRPFIVTREFELKPGDVFNRAKVERDLQRVYGLGIFDDVKLSLNPGEDPRKVVVVANVVEKNTGSIAAGAGISSASGLFGTVSYQQQNIGGNNQKLGAEVQIGERELLFDLSFTDPWIGGDPYRTSYTVNLFRRQTISLIFDGGGNEVRLANGDRPRIVRTGGGISFTRPLNGNPYRRAEWAASLGLQYQHVQITDADGNDVRVDGLGNNLSFSGKGDDDLFSVQFGIVRDLRDDPLRPTRGSLLRLGTEQWLPLGSGSILGNRIRAGYSYYLPTQFIKFTKGCRGKNPSGADCPQTIAFNIQAGTVIGDLPPYEAFALGEATPYGATMKVIWLPLVATFRVRSNIDSRSSQSFRELYSLMPPPTLALKETSPATQVVFEISRAGFGYGVGVGFSPHWVQFGSIMVSTIRATAASTLVLRAILMEVEVRQEVTSHQKTESKGHVVEAVSKPYQHTLQKAFIRSGIGLHTGLPVQVKVMPAQSGKGRYFVRVDLPDAPEIPASPKAVSKTALSTELAQGEASVRTVEHLLAALAGMGVDNARIELDGPEIPLLDGSAKEWVEAIAQVGTAVQPEPRPIYCLQEPVWVRDGDAFVAALRHRKFVLPTELILTCPQLGINGTAGRQLRPRLMPAKNRVMTSRPLLRKLLPHAPLGYYTRSTTCAKRD